MKQKIYQEEQRKKTEKLEQEKAKEKVELDIKKTKLMKEDLQKLCSQLEKDFENLMSKASEKKKSAHILAVKAISLKRTRDEKLKEIEKLDYLFILENLY